MPIWHRNQAISQRLVGTLYKKPAMHCFELQAFSEIAGVPQDCAPVAGSARLELMRKAKSFREQAAAQQNISRINGNKETKTQRNKERKKERKKEIKKEIKKERKKQTNKQTKNKHRCTILKAPNCASMVESISAHSNC